MRGQLIRCGTSPAPNYGEARGAESPKDFIHKLRIVLKELIESGIWLDIIAQSEMLPFKRLKGLINECDELCHIINSSIQTAKANQSQRH